MKSVAIVVLPVLIVAVALALRLFGVDWDQGKLFHPDERAILMKVGDLSLPPVDRLGTLLDADESPWNPKWFPYGSFPLYLLKGIQLAAQPLEKLDIFDLRIPGRVMSALADTLTVILVYALGTRLYGRRVGILASALVALAVVHIQLSHFYAVDTLLTLFTILSLYFLVMVAQGGRLRDSAWAGVFIGIGLATKISLAPIFLAFFLAHLMYALSRDEGREASPLSTRERLTKAMRGALLGGFLTLVVLFIAQPYAFLDWHRFLGDAIEQSEMVRGIRDYPYTRQYIDTTPYWYQLRQLATWGLGLPLGIVAWGGLTAMTLYSIARRRKENILLLSWVIPYFALTGALDVKFMRYFLPITPFLILMGSWAIFRVIDTATALRPILRPWLLAGVGIIVVTTGFYALSYTMIYTKPHPAVRVSQWINENVPQGTVILKEHWEEGIPDLYGYRVKDLPLYEEDTPRKIDQITQELSHAEYLVFFSHRLYATIPRLPERYPISTQYYRLLFSGKLGYELVHYETSYPNLLGVTLRDDTFTRPGIPRPQGFESQGPTPLVLNLGFADESFTVYDHPQTLIFRNVGHMQPEELKTLLLNAADQGEDPALGLVFSPQDAQIQQAGGTWSEIVRVDSWTNRLPLLAWLVLVEGMAFLVLPITFFVFRPLADRGYLFSKPLGILIVSYLVWLLASLRWMSFSQGSIILALLVVTMVSLSLVINKRVEIRSFLKEHWRLMLIGEVVFLVAFLAFFLIRVANPDLWHPFRGGEKPMDFAYLNGVLRSSFMPPYDPWFAGGFLNYYYLGHFMVATLIKATGIAPAVAYNLAIPLFFALTFGAAFSLVFNLAQGTLKSLGRFSLSWSPVFAGLGGGLFVTVLGNLDGAAQVGQGLWRALIRNQPFGAFDFWRSSRLMPPDPPGFEITEFPFFTFLFADLHAHLIALPFTILVMGLGITLIARNRDRRAMGGRGETSMWRQGATLLLLALAVGSLRLLNAWDFPTYMIVTAGLILLGEYLGHGGLGLAVLLRAGVKVGIVFGVGLILFYPFHQNYQTFYTGLEFTTAKTVLWQFLAINGLFVFVILSFLLRETRSSLFSLLSGLRNSKLPLGIRFVPLLLLLVAAALVALLSLKGYGTVAFAGVVLALVIGVGLKWLTKWEAESPFIGFVVILLGTALALVIGVDIFRVEGDISRMNTVFKFYLQIWVMLAVVAAYLLWRLAHHRNISSRRIGLRGGAWLAVLMLLLISASIYPIIGTQVRLRDRFQILPLTVDGMAYMKQAIYRDPNGPIELSWDYEGIRWLQGNVTGSPVILEGRTPLYRWGSRISIYTGLPTVLGWDWHQKQQRRGYDWAVTQREADVNRIYSTVDPDQAWQLMRKYDVRYVYVGQLERLYYSAQGIEKFQRMVGRYLEQVYQIPQVNPQVTIYRLLSE